jgi:ABC-type metal ion transport system substrate-binding protein
MEDNKIRIQLIVLNKIQMKFSFAYDTHLDVARRQSRLQLSQVDSQIKLKSKRRMCLAVVQQQYAKHTYVQPCHRHTLH